MHCGNGVSFNEVEKKKDIINFEIFKSYIE